MASQKHRSRPGADRTRRASVNTASPTGDAGGLNDVDREVIEALAGFRDTLRDRTPLETRYTVRQVVVVEPPPALTAANVREIRESLGLSQPVFADFLGASPSTVRSWEQGQKPPSAMARRLLGLIADDPTYWKKRLGSMVRLRASSRDDSAG